MRIGRAILSTLVTTLGSVSLVGSSSANEPAASEPSSATIPLASGLSEGMGGTLLQLGLALTVILVLILVLQRLARRFGGGLSPYSNGTIEIVAQRSLGNRLSLTVVKVMDQTLLLGLSPQGIERLSILDPGQHGHAPGQHGHAPGQHGHEASAKPLSPEALASTVPAVELAPRPIPQSKAVSSQGPDSTLARSETPSVAAPKKARRLAAASSPIANWLRRLIAPGRPRPERSSTDGHRNETASGERGNLTARAVRKRPSQERSSILNDIEVAAEIAAAAARRKEEEQNGAAGTPEEFEREFRTKLAEMKKKYPTLGEFEDRRA